MTASAYGNSPSDDAPLSQQEYADRVGVSASWISQATQGRKPVSGKYFPHLDAVVNPETGKLKGYQEPEPRPDLADSFPPSSTQSDKSSEDKTPVDGLTTDGTSPRYGQSGRAHPPGQSADESNSGSPKESSRRGPRENPSTPQGMRGGETPTPGSRTGSGNSERLDDLFGEIGKVVAQKPNLMFPVLRLIGATGGALLFAHIASPNPWVVLAGGAAGLLVTEYCLQAPIPRQQPRFGRATGLYLPSISHRESGAR